MIRGKKAARGYLIHLTVGCFLVQFLARVVLDRFSDQRLAAALFGWIAWAITLSQWLCVLHVDRTTGLIAYADDNASLLVLTISAVFIQGLIVCAATGYCAARCAVQSVTYVAFVTWIVYQHVPSGPNLLLTEAEFLGLFYAIVVALHALAVSQI